MKSVSEAFKFFAGTLTMSDEENFEECLFSCAGGSDGTYLLSLAMVGLSWMTSKLTA